MSGLVNTIQNALAAPTPMLGRRTSPWSIQSSKSICKFANTCWNWDLRAPKSLIHTEVQQRNSATMSTFSEAHCMQEPQCMYVPLYSRLPSICLLNYRVLTCLFTWCLHLSQLTSFDQFGVSNISTDLCSHIAGLPCPDYAKMVSVSRREFATSLSL